MKPNETHQYLSEEEIEQNILERIDDIIKPLNDKRHYRGLVLKNNLKVLLISDPETKKSAAALTVAVGSLADPFNKQGLAHLVEHALFISNKKYPRVNSFKDFIVQNGGTTNAFTSSNETTYFFEVSCDAFIEALDRFSQFFLTPLFIKERIVNEIEAVHFEFENTLSNDVRRYDRVRKLIGDPNHDFSKFEIGNKKTLKQHGLHTMLVEFYEKWYSSNIMSLVLFSGETLESLESLSIQFFNVFKDKNVKIFTSMKNPFEKKNCSKQISIIPFKEMRKMILFFALPDLTYDPVKSNSLAYIEFLLAHGGPGGLLSQLKLNGYSTTLIVESYFYNGFGFLDIEVDLTQGIFKNNEIIELVFQYIKMLKSQPAEKWIFDELRVIKQIQFYFKDKFDPVLYVQILSSNLSKFPLKYSFQRALCGLSLLGEFNPETIDEVLNFLTIDNFNVLVISPIFEKSHKLNQFSTDSIYKVKYFVEDIPKKLLNNWRNVELNFSNKLPTPNLFMPNNFTLKKPSTTNQNVPRDKPKLIFTCFDYRVWHLQDFIFQVPKTFYGIIFRNNLVNLTPVNINMIDIFINLFNDYVAQFFYSASLLGISHRIAHQPFGLEITVHGLDDKLDLFVQLLIYELTSFTIDPKRYEIIKDCYFNQLKAFKARPIPAQLLAYEEILLHSNQWTNKELIDAMNQVNINDTTNLIRNILSHSTMEVFSHGNITETESIDLAKKIYEILLAKSKIYPLNPMILYGSYRDLKLIKGRTYALTIKNNLHNNHGLLVYYQIGPESLPNRVLLELLHQMMTTRFFNQIRMTENLAYVSFLQPKFSWSGIMGFYILIQSAYEVSYLEWRIDEFINDFERYIEKLPAQLFETEKASYMIKLRESFDQLFAYSDKLWMEILCGQYVFDRNQIMNNLLKETTQKMVLKFYKEHFTEQNNQQRRLVIEIISEKLNRNPNLNTDNSESSKVQIRRKKVSDSIIKKTMKNRYKIVNIPKFRVDTERWSLPKLITHNFSV